MASYFIGENVKVYGVIKQKDGSNFNLADFTSFECVITDSAATSYTYTAAASEILTDGSANSYYFIITAAQSATLTGGVNCVCTATWADGDLSITVVDKNEFYIGEFTSAG
jgi:hypothetical protein